ncbi:DUF4359 domain-containing protein [Calothrix sp. 336/3]|uniref:DUF4359 domain-containing protein n=1 Tax=Calothrix sp. 336/3 TaxID=1337936 RepID=UPI000624E350|nr:DUF4359 domain-containing protein [Calothrix sp. 336/3]AKG21092.1 hypothetical protein IJ00_07095 [Calothrix sp. 336/3]
MKLINLLAGVGVIGLVVLGGVMAKTNPPQEEYESYATGKLTEYVKTNVCKKTTGFLEKVINFQCDKVLDSGKTEIRNVIAGSTKRQDYIIFSIYTTNLNVNSLVPGVRLDAFLPTEPVYQFESIGVFGNFYTYKAEQKGKVMGNRQSVEIVMGGLSR